MILDDISILLTKNKNKIFKFVIACTLTSIIYSFFIANHYFRSVAKIYPIRDDSSLNSNLSSANPILKSFGYSFNSSYKKIDFHIPDLVLSEMMMDKILAEEFYISDDFKKVNLITFWELSYTDLDKSYFKAKKKLLKLIDVSTDDISPMVTISIQTEDPVLSADILFFIVDEIEKYIVDKKNKLYENKGSEISKIRKKYKLSLKTKQDDLIAFIKQNAQKLAREDIQTVEILNNKKREITFDEQAYSFLTRDFIQSNIESQTKIAIHSLYVPKTRIIDSSTKKQVYNPEFRIDEQKSSPKRILIVLLSFIISFFSYFYFLIIKDKYEQLRSES